MWVGRKNCPPRRLRSGSCWLVRLSYRLLIRHPGAIMSSGLLSQRTVIFVNLAHALDHFVLLIYPTAVIAIAAERGLDYSALIGLATGAFVAFGLFSLPMGWLSGRFGRRNLLAAFFGGCG